MSQQDALLRERLREAALALRELRLERDALLSAGAEPIAIVGMGCRLPGGADSPRAFWDLLTAGRDAVVPLEPRWELVGAHPDVQVPRWAGLLSQPVDAFDPMFFGISPREARALDPQHRLLLEVAWEALEDAGIAALSLKQSPTGVFIGACANDYADLAARQPASAQDAYLTTGNMLSIAAGRLSYTLGLQGPCMALDTACSSSLVALHLACRSLRSKESDLALAGGVSLILSPDSMMALARTQALSPDGRCRTFDALANGYVRGEGCGLLVLKRLSDAQRAGDRIWAMIRGSAVNQDGRSTGLTAPNVLAQEALLRQALTSGGIDPEAVGYVETHGTGTPLGDPIEVQALREVLGRPRPDGGRCVLGAVKTNIGHLEAAAGVAGVIKAALALAMERIPKNLHLRTLNAHIELFGSSLLLATEPLPWPRSDRPRFAGVSGFGLSGTNAHLVLEESPAPIRAEPAEPSALPFLLSGRSETALRSQAARLGAHLAAHPDVSLLDVAHTLANKRSHFEHRASLVTKTREELHGALAALAQGLASPLVRTAAVRSSGRLAFLFTGQGSQRAAMGRPLARAFPQFREALEAVQAAFDPLLPRLREVMSAEPGAREAQLLDQTGYTQPALFALQVALYRLLESLGLVPHFLLGHSVGEIAAAHVAGVLSLKDACRLVVARGQLMQALPQGGAMVALQATESEVRPLLAGREPAVDIAALNGSLHTVISGDEDAVLEIARHFESCGRRCTRLSVSHAFHSPHMDAMGEAFGKLLAELSFQAPRIPIISSLLGERAADGELVRPAYWVRQARGTVQFQRGMATLCAAGVSNYVELGPRGVLCAMGAECLSEAAAQQSELVPILRGEAHEPSAFLQALGRLHVRGIAVDFDALLRPLQPKMIELPTYPFQRQRCWLDVPRRGAPGGPGSRKAGVEHPLLDTAAALGGQDSYLFSGQLSAATSPWLLDHSIFSRPIFPGTGFIDLALCAAQVLGLPGVTELVLSSPLTPADSAAVELQLIVQAPDAQGTRPFVIGSRAASAALAAPFTQHGTGVLGAPADRVELEEPAQWPPADAEPVSLSGLYAALAERGLHYGPAYQGLRAVWKAADAVYVQARLPDALHQEAARYRLHPALLDTTLHGLAAVLPSGTEDAAVMLVAWQGVRLFTPAAIELRARLSFPTQRAGDRITTSLVAWDDRGQMVLAVEEVTLQRVRAGQLDAVRPRQSLYSVQWAPVRSAARLERTPELGEKWVLGGGSEIARRLPRARRVGIEGLDERLRSEAPPAQLLIDATEPAAELEPSSAHAQTHEALRALQAWLRDDRLAAAELVCLTRGAVSAGPDEDVPALAQAPLWGLLRSARSEHPDRRLRLLDVEASSTQEEILAALQLEGEPELALRSGVPRAPRLVSLAASPQLPAALKVAPRWAQGTVLITGGTGELAAFLARHLVSRHGARNLLLLSRRGMQAPGAEALLHELTRLHAAVRIVPCDVSDPQALAEVIRAIPATAPLCSVFHCAAELDDGVVSALSADRIDRVFAPKLDAAWHLHTLTRSIELDAFILFSSAAGILGPPGQANYSAANAFLDALASYRRHRGLPAQSLAWGPWSNDKGLAAKLTAHDLQRQGIGLISAAEGAELLDAALGRSEPLLVPMRLLDDRMRELAEVAPPLFRTLVGPTMPRAKESGPSGASDASGVKTRLRALPPAEQAGEVLELVRREVAAVLGLPSGTALTPEQTLRDLGLDSLMAIELRNRLQSLMGVRFELSAIWKLGNLREFAAELVRLLAAQTAPAPPSRTVDVPAATKGALGRPLLAPLSAGQERLYFLDRVLELRHTYNLSLAFRLPAALDIELLRSAVEQLIARHEQLRVCFVEQGGQPRQRILPWVEPPIEELSLTASEGERDAALRRLIETESQNPFALSRAPLFRLLYVSLGQAGCALAVIWHHIATDGASVAIFFAELSAALQTLREGRDEELAAGPSYALYASRQREWLQTDACTAQRTFWRSKLEGLPALELPSDRPVSRQRTERGGLVTFTLPTKTAAQIEALAKRLGSTSFAVLSAAWATLLSRYSGQEDFAIGVTMVGRHEDALRDAVGFFVNTLPLRCQLHGEPTGLEFLQRVHKEIWAALEHQELPLDEIVRAVAPDRQAGFIGSPLFRTLVSYNEHRESIDSFAGLPATALVDPVIDKVGGTSKFDLLLSVMKRPHGFAAALEFSTDLFDTDTVERCAQHFVMLLTGLVEQPERRISELPLLTPEERQRILFAWNDTDAEYPRSECIHHRFEAQAGRTPDAVALVHGGEQLSYAALNERANQVAHRLRSLGVGSDGLVALCAERSIEMVVAILGILKAGGAYVPIDPDSPAERIDFMLQDTRPAALLTQRELIEKLPRTSVATLFLDDPSSFAGQPVKNPIPVSTSANLAYVIYTSGSTGRPKGVLMEHHSVNNLLQALNRRAWGSAPLRTAMLAPLFFDMSVKPLFGSLLYGHTLYIVDEKTRRDGSALLSFFQRHAIAWSDCTPSILTMLVDAGLPTCEPLALQVLLCGGEALSTALVASVYAPGVLPELRIINVYGPTETCVNVNANPVTVRTLDTSRAVVPMGRPFENTQLYVLDAHLQPVPVGVPGELHIGGVGLARGYLNRPDLTAEKFIPNPFVTDPGARIYKTGDLVRYLPDGRIEFLGRRDHQVKIRGYRIELGEIEAVLAAHPEVGSCTVMAREDVPFERRLVAYVVPQPGHFITAEALRAHLTKQLPDYMLPAAFVSLPALPLTRNGKVDRRALPAPRHEQDPGSFVPPENPLEQALADIFSSVLKKQHISRHDDFFALGGDSLLAVRAVTRAQRAGLPLTVNQLFRGPTLAKLHAAMTGGTGAGCVMRLKEGQAPGGVVLVPGAGGVLHRAHDIARGLDVMTPAFGVIPPALGGMKGRPASVQELAALYAQDLLKCVPQGPLALIGYSFGGAVAIEIAAALREQQRAVDLVILLDARPGTRRAPRELDTQTAISALLDTLGIPAGALQGAASADPLMSIISHLAPDLQEAQGLRDFLGSLLENAQEAARMLAAWQPRLPDVPVHLLRVEGSDERGADYGWSQYGPLASVQTLPGQHYSLFGHPYLDTTMRAIRSLLDRGGMKRP